MRDARLRALSRSKLFAVYRAVSTMLWPVAFAILKGRSLVGKEETNWKHIRHRLGIWREADDAHYCVQPMINRGNCLERSTSLKTLWFHSASVGESKALLPLIRRLMEVANKKTTSIPTDYTSSSSAKKASKSCHNCTRIVVSVGTLTGRKSFLSDLNRLLPKLPDSCKIPIYIVPPPVDIPNSVRGFLDHWQPQGAIFVESELWPNMIYELACREVVSGKNLCGGFKQAARVPLALVNGRMSQRSFERWQYFGPSRELIGGLLSQFDCLIAQSDKDFQRFQASANGIGKSAGTIHIAQNMKLAQLVLPTSKYEINRAKLLFQRNSTKFKMKHGNGRHLRFVVASTHEGEEELVVKALILHENDRTDAGAQEALSTIIVPRHPDRVDALARDLHEKFNIPVQIVPVSYIFDGVPFEDIWDESKKLMSSKCPLPRPITIVKGIGALTALYNTADIALVGGALLPKNHVPGQHNIIEPLQHGCITLHGSRAYEDESFSFLKQSLLKQEVTEKELNTMLRPFPGGEAEGLNKAMKQIFFDFNENAEFIDAMKSKISSSLNPSFALDNHWRHLEPHFFKRNGLL